MFSIASIIFLIAGFSLLIKSSIFLGSNKFLIKIRKKLCVRIKTQLDYFYQRKSRFLYFNWLKHGVNENKVFKRFLDKFNNTKNRDSFTNTFYNALHMNAKGYLIAFNKYGSRQSNTLQINIAGYFHIEGNEGFLQVAFANKWEGNGTFENPYIIKDYEISASHHYGIHIQNTDVYFKIENVEVKYGRNSNSYGIYLENVKNGKLVKNDLNKNFVGITLVNSINNILVENYASYNHNDFGKYKVF